MTDFNQRIIPYYSPVSARGGKRRRSLTRKLSSHKFRSHKFRSRKYKRTNRRTRRTYH